MSGLTLGLGLFALTLVLIALRMPVALAMLLTGGAGYALTLGWEPLVNTLKTLTYARFSSYTLSVIPLFILMGHLATEAGLNRALFRAARAWFGHLRGGLAIATVGGCAMFGAICGSSLATAATMSQVALPEMRRYGYSRALATGTLAAGGTLGILIPPSVILVIYAVYTEQSLGHLFLAAVVPGLIATLGYMLVVAVYVRVAPAAGPAGERAGRGERLASLREIWPVALVFLLVVGGIYLGWFSPTEGAAIGASAVGLLAVVRGGMRWAGLRASLLGTAETTAMIFLILLAAELFNAFLALTQMPATLAAAVERLEAPPMLLLGLMLAFYLLLGCVMESLAMILLTIPVFYPMVLAMDLGLSQHQVAVWFGILALVSVEVGMITPPFGLNIFVIHAMARDVPMAETFKGVLPFVASEVLRIILLLLVPGLALALPGLL
ncbi:MAG: TRAP transporter large permease [Proteobacteria bacterium]|nr:TRAP transporter large permease [Pseudomonadota bacterium]